MRLLALVLLLSGCADAAIDAVGGIAIDEGLSGLTLGVEQHGVRHVHSFGRARLSPDTPLGDDAVWEIGSITKQFTAALAMQLVETGKLRLDATVGELLPDAPAATRPVTLAQLLSHTGGVPDYLEQPDWTRATSAADELALIRDQPLRFAPGRQWAYSNSGYLLVGQIVARAAGKPWELLVAERILRPIGLADTRVCAPPGSDPRRPLAYAYDGTPAPRWPMFPAADGALCSTAADLFEWTRALAGGRVVSHDSYVRMTTPARLASGAATQYGFGLQLFDRGGHRVIAHNGRVNTFSTVLERWPDDDSTVFAATNTHSNLAGYAAMQLGDALVHHRTGFLAVRVAWVHRRAIAVGAALLMVIVVVWSRRRRR